MVVLIGSICEEMEVNGPRPYSLGRGRESPRVWERERTYGSVRE